MRLPDLMATGWTEIWAHKMRSFLSFFAIAIGIATFFYTLSVLSQRYRQLDKSAALAGVGRVDTEIQHPLNMTQYKDLQYMLPEGSSLSFVTPRMYGGSSYDSIHYRGNVLSGFGLVGVMPSWKDSNFTYKLEGRFINWQDVVNKHNVVVLTVYPNEKKKRKLLDWMEPIDKMVKLKEFTMHHNLLNQSVTLYDKTFTVIGLLHVPPINEDVRLEQDQEDDTRVYIPYTTWYDLFASDDYRHNSTDIRIITGKESAARTAGKALSSYLRSQFGPNEKPEIEFFHEKLEERLKEARKSLSNMLFMGIIAMIAGGIGIMNVTMAVIFSRTKEIGVRRALGASRKDILFQFVIEAMLLGLCGAVAGMILGYMAVLHLAEDTSQMTFSWWVVALSVLIALVTSFLFALYPAWQAAKLKPVDALKNE
ncbi:MAG: ABC transporter permease [Elusimicrobiaceae bacterium]|nr:ABC transporter permease [Elusimicrobiaceae bacterium]